MNKVKLFVIEKLGKMFFWVSEKMNNLGASFDAYCAENIKIEAKKILARLFSTELLKYLEENKPIMRYDPKTKKYGLVQY